MSLGSRIRKCRLKKGFTQRQAADKLHMTESNFSSYERDKSIPPSEKLNQIASLFNVSADYLLGRDTNENPSTQPYYSLTSKDERDIDKRLQSMMDDLAAEDAAIAFMGEPMDDEDKELLKDALGNALRMAKQLSKKKFTPKKYRN